MKSPLVNLIAGVIEITMLAAIVFLVIWIALNLIPTLHAQPDVEALKNCKMNAPPSAMQCKPDSELPSGGIEIDRHIRSGSQSEPSSYCERQRVWVVGGVCNYCRIKDQECAT